MNMLIF